MFRLFASDDYGVTYKQIVENEMVTPLYLQAVRLENQMRRWYLESADSNIPVIYGEVLMATMTQLEEAMVQATEPLVFATSDPVMKKWCEERGIKVVSCDEAMKLAENPDQKLEMLPTVMPELVAGETRKGMT